MGNRRRIQPRSSDYNSRLIERVQDTFTKGMFRQQDTEGTDIPDGGVADAKNVRACGSYYEGRPGSRLFTPAKFGFTKTATAETIKTSFASGELYVANGNARPAVGDIFMLYGENDFSGGNMATAKGDSLRKYDLFRVTNATVDSESVFYLGSLRNPPLPGYGDTTATEFTASKAGTTITATVGTFDGSHVGSYFAWYDGTRDLITKFLTDTTVSVFSSGTVNSASKGVIHAPMNASLFHRGCNRMIALFGRRFYISTAIPFSGWTEIPGVITPNQRPIDTTETEIRQSNDDAIAINPNGVYRIKLNAKAPYYWKANTPIPSVKLTDTAKDKTLRYKYRYVYSLGRITGASIFDDRFDLDKKVLLEQESAPTAIDTNNIDYAEVLSDEPVGDESETCGRVLGATLSAADLLHTAWNTITNGCFGFTLNTDFYNITVDLTSVETLSDVAYKIQNSIRTVTDLQDVTVEFDKDHFVMKSGVNDSFGASITSGTSGGTDISSKLKFSTATISDVESTKALAVGTCTMPAGSEQANVYCIYRTQDLGEKNLGDPGLLAWVKDLPAMRVFTGSITASTLTLTSGTIEREDEGCEVKAADGTRFTLTTWLTSTTATVSETTLGAQAMAIGSETTPFTASQAGATITISSGITLVSATHVGKQIYWADGGTSVIKSVTNTSTAVAVWGDNHAAQTAGISPTSRTFTDTVSDEDLDARFSAYPLRNRFQVPIPNGSIGAVAPGFVFTAMRGSNRFNYCDVQYAWLLGYYHQAFQKSEEVWDGIQAIIVNDGYCTMRGSVSVYRQSTINFMDVGDNILGESVNKLPSLKVISEGFGSIGSGASQMVSLGNELFVTTEPGLRQFNGTEFGDNLAVKTIQRSDLNKMKQTYVAGYNPICGEFIWGLQEK